jgi:uncharacterized protein YbaA (DUF1428 family)
VPKKNVPAYLRMARKAGKVWREYGALNYVESVADITYKSRKDRDRINAKVMKDPRLASMMNMKAMPFDGKRMIYGGFKAKVEM